MSLSGDPDAAQTISFVKKVRKTPKGITKEYEVLYFDGKLISDPLMDWEDRDEKETVIHWIDNEAVYKVRLVVKGVKKGKTKWEGGIVQETTHLALFVREKKEDKITERYYAQLTFPEWKPEFLRIKAIDVVFDNEVKES